MQRQKYFWNTLVDYGFRMAMDGWENLPDPPGAAGGNLLRRAVCIRRVDCRRAVVAAVRAGSHAAGDRPRRADGDPVIGRYFRAMGVLPAAPDSIATALAEGRDVALWPGGEVDSLRPWADRDRANLAGRTGFVKMAIRAGVPIVPIATVGGADAMPVLIRGAGLSRALRLDQLLRLKVFPLAISLPWGIAPAALPSSPSGEDPHPPDACSRARSRSGPRR